jgi:hypothetical protein
LREVDAVGKQFGQDLEAGDEVGRQLAAQGDRGLKYAVEPAAHVERAMRRFEMNVAGGSFNAVRKNQIYQAASVLGICRLQSMQL